MVKLNNYLKNTNSFQTTKEYPLINSQFIQRFSAFSPFTEAQSFKTFMKWVRRSPSMIGFLSVIATDMLSDRISFTPLDEDQKGANVLNAEKFWAHNNGIQVAEETIYDLLICGIGYNWLGKIQDAQLKELCIDTLKVAGETKELEYKSTVLFEKFKEQKKDLLPRKLRHVAASTMTIQSDQYDITGYIQRVGTTSKIFEKDEILTFKLMPLDGKLYPFPPMECILAEVYLLWLISQNYVSFFENGGKPDNVFILPKELAGSKNHQYLIDVLRKYKRIQNKHGNLVFTGDIQIEQLTKIQDQMENKDLGLYLTSVLAMVYGIPVSRIPFLIGKAANRGDSGGLADSGYWRKISVWQSKLEAVYNKNLWIPYFGVKMEFRRGYLQDEVRETQTKMQKVQIAEQLLNIGLWDLNSAGKYLNIDPRIVKKAQEEKKKRDEEIQSKMLKQNLDNNDNVLKEPDAKLRAKTKQQTQLANQVSAGGKKINP